MLRRAPWLAALALAAAPASARAGGGPMNVVVVYSSDDPGAAAVADHYALKRSLPVGHACAIPGLGAPAPAEIDAATFSSAIRAPLDACLAALPHPDEVDYLVLVRGLPYRVALSSFTVSLEAALQVGHTTRTQDGSELAGAGQPQADASVPNPLFPGNFFDPALSPVTNPYSAWYASGAWLVSHADQRPAFRRRDVDDVKGGFDFTGQLFVVQSLDGFDHQDAMDLVDRGVAADGTFPTAELLCMHGEDDARGARDPECELVTRLLAGAGLAGTFVDPFDPALAGHTVAAYFTGSADSVKGAIDGNVFVPGAIADNLTSFGALPQNFVCSPDGLTCPESEAQTSVARFVRAGATGAHGTANEPFNNPFPNAGTMIHYTFGYSMGESFLFNQRFLYWQNVHLGDPLTSPWAERPVVELDADTASARVSATHPNGVARIDLYASGVRVASVDGASELSLDAPGAEGQELDLLAVAVAANAPVVRAGWPEEMQAPAPDVQGWTAKKIVLAAPAGGSGGGGGGGGGGGAGGGGAGAGGGGSGGAPGADGGCGCGLASTPATGWLAVLGLAALAARRRRFQTPTSGVLRFRRRGHRAGEAVSWPDP